MSTSLWMLVGYCATLLAGGYVAKTVRDYRIKRIQPELPLKKPTKTEPEEKPKVLVHAGR